VEGFYGAPWNHQDRLEMLRFEGQHGMNVYYYAPKDDPYHRKLWREPYPPEQMKQLDELVSTARAGFVDFCFAISPGLSMVYSSEEDFSKLTAKLASVGKLGVSCFALFLDDVPPELQSPQDRERFPTLAQAHASLINKLDGHLKSQSKDNRLVVTPTTYTNEWGSRDYIRELGSAVNEDVAIVWTGPEVASPAITVAQAREWSEWLRRKPLVWDNFPVNDGRPWRVHLGPLRGRDANLPDAIRGVFSNPMNQPRASMLPLETIADYLWNPAAYDPERSLKKAVTAQYGDDAPRVLATWLKTYGDYWWDERGLRHAFCTAPHKGPATRRRFREVANRPAVRAQQRIPNPCGRRTLEGAGAYLGPRGTWLG
jgi:hyaluronoglucosaminidase